MMSEQEERNKPSGMMSKSLMEGYVEALRAHDWSHEFSDDARVWRRGVAEYTTLQELQRAVDPLFEVWNVHCHAKCKNGVRYT